MAQTYEGLRRQLVAGVVVAFAGGAALHGTISSAETVAQPQVENTLSPALFTVPVLEHEQSSDRKLARAMQRDAADTDHLVMSIRMSEQQHEAAEHAHELKAANQTAKWVASTLRRERTCESGGNYSENTGNGYYGAYQFDLSTWHSLGLTGYPNQASKDLQDIAVLRLVAKEGGWEAFPACGYDVGLPATGQLNEQVTDLVLTNRSTKS